MLGTAQGAAIAGWQNLSLNLSAGTFGLRHLLIVLDETGRPIAASIMCLSVGRIHRIRRARG